MGFKRSQHPKVTWLSVLVTSRWSLSPSWLTSAPTVTWLSVLVTSRWSLLSLSPIWLTSAPASASLTSLVSLACCMVSVSVASWPAVRCKPQICASWTPTTSTAVNSARHHRLQQVGWLVQNSSWKVGGKDLRWVLFGVGLTVSYFVFSRMSCETSFVFCGPTLLNGQNSGKSTELEEKARKSNTMVKTRLKGEKIEEKVQNFT